METVRKTYHYKNDTKHYKHIDNLVNPVKQARFKPLPKQKRFLEDMVRVTLKWFKITTIYCEPATLEGKNISSPFLLIHQIISPHAGATH